MKIRETSPAISTGLASWASENATAPFSSLRPVAVISPETILIPGSVGLQPLGQPILERVEPHPVQDFRWWRGT